MNNLHKITTNLVANKIPKPKTPPIRMNTANKKYNNTLPVATDHFIYAPLDGLPCHGWIQGCILCYEPTTRIEKLYTHDTYICGRCSSMSKRVKLTALNLFK